MTMVAIRRPWSVAVRSSDDEEKKGKDERGGMSRISRAPAFLRHSKTLEVPIGPSASADRLIQTPRAA
jgi:hypothetical protein